MDTNFFTLAGKLSDSKIVFLEVKFYLFVIEFFTQLIIYDLSSSTGTVILRLFFFTLIQIQPIYTTCFAYIV